MSFELECRYFAGSVAESHYRNPVFVSGLARSGTTALLRVLHDTCEFESLTYRDMPFVLMPRLWGRIARPLYKTPVSAERAHGDSVMVDFDSPEGFECVFWKTFTEGSFDSGTMLRAHEPGPGAFDKFRTYVAMIAARSPEGPRRYLSKNNNNLMRLAAIRNALPDAGIVVLYRDPVQTAASSLRQHLRFCDRQRADPFILQYMNWLGHHEFGLGHKPFQFGKESLPGTPFEPDYWLHYWIAVYRHLATSGISFRFVNYEDLCTRPEAALRALFGYLGVKSEALPHAPKLRLAQTTDLPRFRPGLVEEAREIHERLCADGRNIICPN
jgi:hypothetical protein